MVLIKIAAILIFVFGAVRARSRPRTGIPFMPNGFSGVLTGAAIVFFTYIGFDSVSTAAEECTQSAARPALRDHRHADRLHDAVRRRCRWCSPASPNTNTLDNAARWRMR